MTFTEAKLFRMPFGAYKGKALDKIAESDAGLLYLDRLRGKQRVGAVSRALRVYLDDPDIKADLKKLVEGS